MRFLIIPLLLTLPLIGQSASRQESNSSATEYATEGPSIANLRAKAILGDARAQYELGVSIGIGSGVPADRHAGARWVRRAAEQGYVKAQMYLGLLYEFGKGVPQDYEQALLWFGKAADNGDASAQASPDALV